MEDSHGRTIDYVRISITDRCNLRCIYCMPEKGIESVSHNDILSYEEIIRVCIALSKIGIKKIKITGGEPLVRKDCASLISGIKAIEGIEKVTITTNGILLKDQVEALAAAGVDSVNISLDTLDRKLFAQITRGGCIDDVLAGIKKAAEYPSISIKINCVPIYDENKQGLAALAGLAKDHMIHVRFIEMMPIGLGKNFKFKKEEQILKNLEAVYGPFTPYEGVLGYGPSHYYTVDGFMGKIGFISAITHKFCNGCNRVRLTAEGYLKTCLQYEIGTDLRPLLKAGCNEAILEETIKTTIYNKPSSHNFEKKDRIEAEEFRSMSQIGG